MGSSEQIVATFVGFSVMAGFNCLVPIIKYTGRRQQELKEQPVRVLPPSLPASSCLNRTSKTRRRWALAQAGRQRQEGTPCLFELVFRRKHHRSSHMWRLAILRGQARSALD